MQQQKRLVCVTAANFVFKKYINNLLACLQSGKINYQLLLYDLGGLEQGIPFECRVSQKSLQTIPAKPAIIKDAIERIPYNAHLVWLDADVLIKEKIDEIVTDDYDIGVTLRKKTKRSKMLGSINAGVLFFNKTPNTLAFLEEWGELSLKRGGDQVVLNELCDFPIEKVFHIIYCNSLRIKSFPCEVYNNFYFETKQQKAKIFHYKGKARKLYPKTLSSFFEN